MQAKYLGPCLVEKRMSELVYATITPARRKRKQICHINMHKRLNLFTTIHDRNFRRHSSMNVTIK